MVPSNSKGSRPTGASSSAKQGDKKMEQKKPGVSSDLRSADKSLKADKNLGADKSLGRDTRSSSPKKR